MQIWAESGKSALPICNYSQILYQFLTFTQNLKRSLRNRKVNTKKRQNRHLPELAFLILGTYFTAPSFVMLTTFRLFVQTHTPSPMTDFL